MLVYQKYVEIDTKRRFDIAAHHVDGVAYKIKERKVDRSHFLFGEAHLIIEESLEIAYLRKSANLVWRFRHQRSFFSYKIYRTQKHNLFKYEFQFPTTPSQFSLVASPRSERWSTFFPSKETLEQEEAMIE